LRQLVPGFTEPALPALGSILAAARQVMALQHVVVPRRRA
jgi:hypothetical protein